RNPVTGVGESWRLTGPSQWVIVGFYLLFTIGLLVYVIVAGMIVGGILGAVAGGSAVGAMLSMIVMAALVYLPIIMISFSMPVGIYRAIAPRASGDVFAWSSIRTQRNDAQESGGPFRVRPISRAGAGSSGSRRYCG